MNTALNTNTPSHMNDERSVVRELQHMLRFIARFNPAVIPVNPDGIFGQKTEDSVKSFQKLQNLPTTGEVDHNVWNEIRRVFQYLRDIHLPANPVRVYPPELNALSPGDRFDEVLILQVMLKRLADRYDNIPAVDISGVYDPKTRQTVIKLQEVFRIDQSGMVDKQTWNKISSLYSVITDND